MNKNMTGQLVVGEDDIFHLSDLINLDNSQVLLANFSVKIEVWNCEFE